MGTKGKKRRRNPAQREAERVTGLAWEQLAAFQELSGLGWRDVERAPALKAYLCWIVGWVEGGQYWPVDAGQVVRGVKWETVWLVRNMADRQRRSRWRRAVRAPSVAFRSALWAATKDTHTPIPIAGWPGDEGYLPQQRRRL